MTTIAAMKNRRDLDPVGPLDHVDDGGVDEDQRDRGRTPDELAAPPRRADERVTATAAEVISTSTPVAYAPPWASTSARKMSVTTKAIAVKTRTSGRVARAQSGAMP